MLWLKLIHVSKKGHGRYVYDRETNQLSICQNVLQNSKHGEVKIYLSNAFWKQQ